MITEATASFATTLENEVSMPFSVDHLPKTGKTGECLTEKFKTEAKLLQICENCLSRAKTDERIIIADRSICECYCDACWSQKGVCQRCKAKGQVSHYPACKACTKCLEEGKECIKVAASAFTSDCEEGSKKAMETINQQVQDGSIEPELALMVALPDTIHLGKSLKCSFANWFILLQKQRANLAILRTLRDDNHANTRRVIPTLLKDSDAVRNNDRMAVDPVLDLTAEAFINELKDINLVVYSLVPERFKFAEDNKVGAYPHPVDVTNAGNGLLFMLDFAPISKQSRLIQLQLHNPVRTDVVMEKLSGAQSLCACNGFVFLSTTIGIVVVEHTNRGAIKVQSLKKPELIAELTKRGIDPTGNVKELKERLNARFLQLKMKYTSEQKRDHVLHLNKDVAVFDLICSASDERLLASCNTQKQFCQISVEKDGVGLTGSVTELVAYPEGTEKVASMTVCNGNLYFSSEGPKGGLFQFNLASSVISCLVSASEQCKVHGVAAFNEGIAFSDPKAH